MTLIKPKLNQNKRLIRSIISGILAGLALTALLTILCAWALSQSGKLPRQALDYITLAFCGMGALLGGYLSARINKSAGLICGVAVGFGIFLIIFLSGFSVPQNELGLMSLYKLAAVLVPSAVGGILGVNRKQKIKFK